MPLAVLFYHRNDRSVELPIVHGFQNRVDHEFSRGVREYPFGAQIGISAGATRRGVRVAFSYIKFHGKMLKGVLHE